MKIQLISLLALDVPLLMVRRVFLNIVQKKEISIYQFLFPLLLPPAPPRKHPAPRTTRCRSFEDFALKVTAKKRKRGYRRALGIKRCRSKRTIRPRIDPRVSWPRIPDFMERFRLPPTCVEELTREFERSRFRPGKGEEENRGSPIPLLHKVCFLLSILISNRMLLI